MLRVQLRPHLPDARAGFAGREHVPGDGRGATPPASLERDARSVAHHVGNGQAAVCRDYLERTSGRVRDVEPHGDGSYTATMAGSTVSRTRSPGGNPSSEVSGPMMSGSQAEASVAATRSVIV